MVTTEALSISPYVGPRPFEAADRGAFFGRAGEVSRLVSEVIANPTVLVYAVSGAGKTSLLAAGLAPALIEQGFEALPLARVGGGAPPPDAANAFVYCALQSIAHLRCDVVTRTVDQLRKVGERCINSTEIVQCALSGDRLDASHTGCNP